ncbi:hypothetical protein BTW01_15090 [Bacillus sp. SKDU12]|nr:hypothetical protein BTW01_15090 [Bacillus sp. SKDU12]
MGLTGILILDKKRNVLIEERRHLRLFLPIFKIRIKQQAGKSKKIAQLNIRGISSIETMLNNLRKRYGNRDIRVIWINHVE